MFRFVISASILAASLGAASAAPKCPPGEIYRVTKKVCVNKTDAVRDGIFKVRQKAAKVRGELRHASLAPQTTPESKPAPKARSDDPSSSGRNASTRVTGTVATARFVDSVNSPFGSLLYPWRSDTINVSPETRFSLQFATQD